MGDSLASSGDVKWKCPICDRVLSGSPLSGRVAKHANQKGEACRGAGKMAVKASQPSSTRGQVGTRGDLRARKKEPSKTTNPAFLVKPTGRPLQQRAARPEVLPQKGVAGRAAHTGRDDSSEAYWSLFGDVLKQDLETDRNWLKVRLGTSQGTGKKR
jgi:hypothetical protein